jgi:hypothetical protein
MLLGSGGEFGFDICSNMAARWPIKAVFGVDAVLGIFCLLSFPFLERLSETDCVEA